MYNSGCKHCKYRLFGYTIFSSSLACYSKMLLCLYRYASGLPYAKHMPKSLSSQRQSDDARLLYEHESTAPPRGRPPERERADRRPTPKWKIRWAARRKRRAQRQRESRKAAEQRDSCCKPERAGGAGTPEPPKFERSEAERIARRGGATPAGRRVSAAKRREQRDRRRGEPPRD